MAVGELHDLGVDIAKNAGIKNVFQFDIMKNPFVDEFDVVGMFDVLEHIDDDRKALSYVTRMLKSVGKLILSLPIHMGYGVRMMKHQSIIEGMKIKALWHCLKNQGTECCM